MNSNYDFDTGERLQLMMDIERLFMNMKKILDELKFNEERRINFKDLLTSFKEGCVQKDIVLSYYFNDNTFIKMGRRDCLSSVEKEVAKLNKEITKLKEDLDIIKSGLVNKLIRSGIDLNEVEDDDIVKCIQKEYVKRKQKEIIK